MNTSLARAHQTSLPQHTAYRPARPHPARNAVYQSVLPGWLKDGVAGALASMLDDDDTVTISIGALVKRGVYTRGRRWKYLCYRILQYQIMTLVALGILERLEGGSGGRPSRYHFYWRKLRTLPRDVQKWQYGNRNPLIARGVPSPRITLRNHATGNHATAALVKYRSFKRQKDRAPAAPLSRQELEIADRILRNRFGECRHQSQCHDWQSCRRQIALERR